MQAPEGPQPLLGLGWGPGRPPLSPTVPTAASSSASLCDETPIPPPPADVFFAATGVEGSMFCPPPRRTPPRAPWRRNVAQGNVITHSFILFIWKSVDVCYSIFYILERSGGKIIKFIILLDICIS